MTEQLFETLVGHEAATTRIVPALARTWERSSDGSQWTLTLREGMKFHDGTPVDAEAVAFNFERARTSAHPQRGSDAPDRYVVYAALWGGFDDGSVIRRVEALDGSRVRFTMTVPFAPFLANLASPSFAIVSPASVRADPANFGSRRSGRPPAGTGPFLMGPSSWKEDAITLERNAAYWKKGDTGEELPELDRVVIRSVADPDERARELRAGRVQAARDFPPSALPAIRSDPNLAIVARPAFNVAYLGVSMRVAPLDRLEVRRAIAMAVNRRLIADTVYAGLARPATQFLPPRVGVIGYDEGAPETPYDPDGARRALAAARLSGRQLDLWYPPISRPYFPDPKRIAEAIAADLGRAGFVVRLNTIDWPTYQARARSGAFGLWLYGLVGDSGDPDAFLCSLFCATVRGGREEARAGGGWANRIVWTLLRDGRLEADPARRAELYKQIGRIARDELPLIPLFHVDQPVAMSRNVSGYVPHARGTEPFTFVRVGR